MKKAFLARILAAMSAATVAASCLASCGQEPASSQESSTAESTTSSTEADSGTETASGEKGLQPYEEPVTVTMFLSLIPNAQYIEGESPEDNLWTRYIKEQLNIDIEYKWVVTQDQYESKLNTSIASKDFADIMTFKINDKNLKLMNDAGYLLDMTSVYDEYATDYTKSLIEGDGGVSLDSVTFNDKLMAIPNTNAAIEAAPVLWIRSDWLEKGNKEVPTTIDEFYELAKFFKEQDYQQTGNALGFSLDKGSETNALSSASAITTAFGAYPQKWLESEDGSLVYGSIQPEVRDALEFMAKCYQEGLIDQEYGVKDAAKVGEDACNGRLGLYLGGHPASIYPLNGTKAVTPEADWKPYAIPTKDGSPASLVLDIAAVNCYVATKDCKNPEAILKMMNLFTKTCFSEEGDSHYYITGEVYREPFILAPIQTWPMTKNIDIYRRIADYRQNGDISVINNHEETRQMFEYCKKYEETGANEGGWDYARVFDTNGSQQVLAGYLDSGNIAYNAFYGAPTDTMSSKKATLDKMEAQTFSQIIMGASPIEEFDNFVEQWTSLGGAEITKEVNEWAANR